MLPHKIGELIKGMVEVREGKVTAVVENNLKEKWDELVEKAVFGEEAERVASRWLIWEVGQFVGVKPASINDLYFARGRGETPLNFTVPAINVRGMAYDFSRAIFKSARNNRVGLLIAEISQSELSYTNQTFPEFSAVILGAAIREGWRGGLPIQLDHWQTKEGLEAAIEAGFLNIDVDASSASLKQNIKTTLELISLIRQMEPKGMIVSIGGEVSRIGGANSTVMELEEYIQGINKGLAGGMAGLSKISVATGTHHGGVVLADGSLAKTELDTNLLRIASQLCRKFGLAGAVQHGASTLAEKYFKELVKSEVIEVHLATEFQNIIMDHPSFPQELKAKMYQWLGCENNKQLAYTLRKKAWGKFKSECWQLDEAVKAKIRAELEKKLEFLYQELGVKDTEKLNEKWLRPMERHKEL